MQSDPARWQKPPGSLDPLHTAWLFPSDHPLGIPNVPAAPLSAVPEWVAPYRTRIRSDEPLGKRGVHFFLDDYRFESVWNHPRKGLIGVQGWDTVISPDFSLYRDVPLVLQQLNVYRNRWCHAFWAHHGLTVIPTVSWSTRESFPFAFAGIPQRSVVALGTVGTDWTVNAEACRFVEGWEAMLEALDPVQVLVYGTLPAPLAQQVNVHYYPPYWEGIVAIRRKYGR